ncbi:MAG: ABC transporter permease [Caldilineaceae bacterium]
MAIQNPTFPGQVKVNEAFIERKPESYWQMALRTLRRDRLTIVALTFVLIVSLMAIFAGVISSGLGVDPYTTQASNAYQQPYVLPYIEWRLGIDQETAPKMLGISNGQVHWLGTDQLGRDLLSRLIYAGRVSLRIALIAALISLVLGVAAGAVAGYFGGIVDDMIMWGINTITSIPTIYLLIIINSIFTPSTYTLTVFLGVFGWFGTARFMRGSVFRVRELDYALAARAIGARNWRIMLQHIIPNTIPLIIVLTFADIGGLMVSESILSFLGLGVQPPDPSWGNMLNRANSFIFQRDAITGHLQGLHLLLGPGILTTLTVLSFTLIGDGMRDALDPTLKNKA